MRIVSWNCRQGFDAKAEALLALNPAIAVVPESLSSPAIAQRSLLAFPVPHLWTGNIAAKGLGLFAPGADSFEVIDPENDSSGALGIAGRAFHGDRETTILGVWTIPGSKGGNPYLEAAHGIVDRYAKVLASGSAICAGDFNVSGRTDLRGIRKFSEMMKSRFSLISAYHAFHGLKIGDEPTGTLWWRGKENDSFHCDFVFVPESWRIQNLEVGSYEMWGAENSIARSDHAPVIVDLDR